MTSPPIQEGSNSSEEDSGWYKFGVVMDPPISGVYSNDREPGFQLCGAKSCVEVIYEASELDEDPFGKQLPAVNTGSTEPRLLGVGRGWVNDLLIGSVPPPPHGL